MDEKKITKLDIEAWVASTSGDWFYLDDIKKQLGIDDSAYSNLKVIMHRLCQEDVCEAMGGRSGRYRKKDKDVKPVAFWKVTGTGEFPIKHPYGIDDDTTFGFEEKFTFKRGSSYIIGGNTNAGKTAYVNNLLYANMDTYRIKYFCTEANRYKFWDRLQKMDWATPFKRENPENLDDCKFEFIPRDSNFVDVLEGADIYIIDWVNLTDEIWKIGAIIQKMVNKVDRQGEGLVIVVLQKDESSKFARGKTWTLDFADFGVTLDYGRLTVLKCKPNSTLDNKVWGFEITRGGSRFHNIRKVKKCPKCHGYSVTKNTKCENCKSTGYVDVEDLETPLW